MQRTCPGPGCVEVDGGGGVEGTCFPEDPHGVGALWKVEDDFEDADLGLLFLYNISYFFIRDWYFIFTSLCIYRFSFYLFKGFLRSFSLIIVN